MSTFVRCIPAWKRDTGFDCGLTCPLSVPELFDAGPFAGSRCGRQVSDEFAAVLFCYQSRIEYADYPAIRLRAHQAPEPLFEFYLCLGHRIVAEGAAAILLDGRDSRLGDGRIRHGERQAVDNDTGERLSLDIDSLPECLRAE